MDKIKAVKGMPDITPDVSWQWSQIEHTLQQLFTSYAFREIRMPIVESTGLFLRSIGEVTDIVEKEMYSFPDRNGDSMSLRPEGTAGCVRACIERNLLEQPQKLWYRGPMFRYERPQKGRQRQFHQIGAEIFGYSGPAVEAEILIMTARFWQALGLSDSVSLQLNSIGTAESRRRFKEDLVNYLKKNTANLDEDSQRRLDSNPLRILDSKNADTQALLKEAPSLMNYLSDESSNHFAELCSLLKSENIAYEHNMQLVRGLDYYNDTVFEWVSDKLGAQATLCGGGRYDGLVEQLGGKSCPAVGFAMGVERLILLLEQKGFAALKGEPLPDIYFMVADTSYHKEALDLAERLRSLLPDFVIMQHFAQSSLKNQFKKADKSGARFALILAESEIANQQVTVKNMQLGEQKTFAIDNLSDLTDYLTD